MITVLLELTIWQLRGDCMPRKHKELTQGQILNKQGCRFIRYVDKSNGIITIEATCSVCGDPFIGTYGNIKKGSSNKCNKCKRHFNIQYTKGQKMGYNNEFIFLEELEPRITPSGDKQRMGLFQWRDDIFKNAITNIVSEVRKQSPQQAIRNSINRQSKDLVGKKFGMLTAVSFYGHVQYGKVSKRAYVCKCDCGNPDDVIVTSDHLLSGHTTSCGCLRSKGEHRILMILNDLKIKYEREYKIPDCISDSGKCLSFDFYLPEHVLCIEYDGEQHFEWHNVGNGWNTKQQVERTKELDAIKNKYCEDHNIRLIRIPYWDYDKLNEEYLLDLISKEQTCVTPQR